MRIYLESTLTIRATLTVGAWLLGFGMLGFWVGPLLGASAYLMFVFDYLPHRPHLVPHKTDPYASTSVLVLGGLDGVLTPFLFSQNYHNIHHLYPFLPFYQYGAIWRKHKDELIRRGTRVLPLYLLGGRAKYFAELRGEGAPDDFGGRGKMNKHAGAPAKPKAQ